MANSTDKTWQTLSTAAYPFTPATYPGKRPRFSFLFTTQAMYRFSFETLDALLATRNLAPTSERYAVLAYGSNACPGQLSNKYRDYGLTDVPVIYGRLHGAQAVYARRTTANGYLPATLARQKGSTFNWLTLLTKHQLRAMDASEGRPKFYILAEVLDVHFSIGQSKAKIAPLFAYIDVRGGVMTLDARPLSIRSVRQKKCKTLFDKTVAQDAHRWLTFKVVSNLHPPPQFSKIQR